MKGEEGEEKRKVLVGVAHPKARGVALDEEVRDVLRGRRVQVQHKSLSGEQACKGRQRGLCCQGSYWLERKRETDPATEPHTYPKAQNAKIVLKVTIQYDDVS